MNFLRPLICLAASLSLRAQALDLQIRGGGDLKIGATSYRFVLSDLSSAPAKGGLSGAVKLVGNLVPKEGSTGAFRLTLIVLKQGGLYTLRIERRNGKAYPDSWAATVKTKARTLKLDERPGGRVEIQCEGPLTGVIAQRPTQADWSGTLWGVFPNGGTPKD